jgi:hypothetical protein
MEEYIKQKTRVEALIGLCSKDRGIDEYNKDSLALVEFAESFFGRAIETMKKKNADYTGFKDDNPFANFEAVEAFGLNTEIGFLTRMTDKMARIASFVKNGELRVKDESVQDTLLDLANYSMLFAAYLKSIKKTFPNTQTS